MPRRPTRRFALVLALALATLGALAPLAAGAQAQQTTIAQTRVAQLPAGGLLFRFIDLTLPAGQPAVTHMHIMGYAYAWEGTHLLTVGGRQAALVPGQAGWVGQQEAHTHGAVPGAASRFLFVLVGPEANRGLAPAWPYPTAKIGGETAGFQVAAPGPYDLVLSEVRLARPGDTAGALGQRGPAGVLVLEGQVGLDGQALGVEGTALQLPGASGTFTNTGAGAARLLVLQVLPVAQAPGLPATGAGGSAASPALGWLGLLVAAGLVIGAWAGRRLRRRA